MNSLPIFLQISDQPVLVIGGGTVAYRKVTSLLKAGAKVTVVAPEINNDLQQLKTSQLHLVHKKYHRDDMLGQKLVIAATSDKTLNTEVANHAEQLGIWANVVDDTELSKFIFPAIIDRAPIQIAISSAGQAPVMARLLKEKIETLVPRWTGNLAQLAGSFRAKVKNQLPSFQQRRHFWEGIFRGRAMQLAAAQRWSQVEQQLETELSQATLNNTSAEQSSGHVYLVGAGPGDPELLTIKALQAMQLADVIVYDYLVSEEVLDLCRKDAEQICVGKRAGYHSVSQEETNQLLADLAKQGKIVCRLKGGDPYIFGRGGEEALTLVEHDIEFSVVPGITAASACSASAGIPLTHRGLATNVQFVTGHGQQCGDKQTNSPFNWRNYAKQDQTLVIYMGVIKASEIQQRLIESGRAASTPVAIIEKGTRPDQRIITDTLSNLGALPKQHNIGSPALIIVGEVVALHHQLSQQPFNYNPLKMAVTESKINLANVA